MAATVEPFSSAATFTFKKPVPTEKPLTCFSEQFLQRLKEIEGKTKTVNLESGRKICYFDESGKSTNGKPLAVVLCIHGLGQGKELWMFPEPLPNVRLIAIDRIGYGSSSPQPHRYGFKESCDEINEFLEKIDGVDKFYIVGHSAGGATTQAAAAELGGGDNDGRVLGYASLSGMCDMYHEKGPKVNSKEWKKMNAYGGSLAKACGPNPGCCSGTIRNCFLVSILGNMLFFPNKDQDPGFSSLYTSSMRKEDGGCERTWSAMDKDSFFVEKYIYAVLHGCVDKFSVLGDIWRLLGIWDVDISKFKGHCVIYNGTGETTPEPAAENIHKIVSQSELVIMEGHGHTTICMETEGIISALIEGKSAKQLY